MRAGAAVHRIRNDDGNRSHLSRDSRDHATAVGTGRRAAGVSEVPGGGDGEARVLRNRAEAVHARSHVRCAPPNSCRPVNAALSALRRKRSGVPCLRLQEAPSSFAAGNGRGDRHAKEELQAPSQHDPLHRRRRWMQ